jgi:hypothetical protein
MNRPTTPTLLSYCLAVGLLSVIMAFCFPATGRTGGPQPDVPTRAESNANVAVVQADIDAHEALTTGQHGLPANTRALNASETIGIANGGTGVTSFGQSFTATVTSSIGAPTTVSATGVAQKVGSLLIVSLRVIVGDTGTANGSMDITLPTGMVAATGGGTLSAVEYNTTGMTGAGYIASGSTVISVRRDDYTTPWVGASAVWSVSGVIHVVE